MHHYTHVQMHVEAVVVHLSLDCVEREQSEASIIMTIQYKRGLCIKEDGKIKCCQIESSLWG